VNTLDYLTGLFRAEAGRLRAETDPDTRGMTGTSSNDKLAASLDRMAGKIEQTAASGVVEEVA
jgi:hypothetical protein